MSDRLRELVDLDTDRLGVRPTPAAELRARGDRHRRRRYAATTVAAAAAVAVVGLGLNVLGNSGPSEPSPAPPGPTTTPSPTEDAIDEPEQSPSPTAPATQLTIPADFPLAASYPETNEDLTPVRVTGKPGIGGLTLCGETILTTSGAADVAGAKFVGAEDFRARTLLLFENPSDALAVVEQTEQAVEACPVFDNSTFTRVEVPLGDESFGFDIAYDTAQGGFALGLSSYLVVQVGHAVLIGSAYGESTFPNEAFDQALADDARDVVAAMADL